MLTHIQYVQEKETAKNMLQGIKRLQSGFPPMDIDHFAMWIVKPTCILFILLENLDKQC
jgi:hypothetical protein